MKVFKDGRIFLTIITFFVVTVLAVSCGRIYAKEFIDSGVLTNARVVDIIKTTRKKIGSSDLVTYSVKVSYFTKGEKKQEDEEKKADYGLESLNKLIDKINVNIGDLIFAEFPINTSEISRYKKGDSIEIYYLPKNTKKIRPKEFVDKYR